MEEASVLFADALITKIFVLLVFPEAAAAVSVVILFLSRVSFAVFPMQVPDLFLQLSKVWTHHFLLLSS